MFINYFADNQRRSPLNLAVARLILGGYALWKMVSYDWAELAQWPLFMFSEYPHKYFLLFPGHIHYLPLFEGILIIVLICFMAGYRVSLTGFASALLIAHICSYLFVVSNANILLMAVHLLVLYVLFAGEDRFYLAHFKASKGSADGLYTMNFLKWTLVTIAMAYFFSGYGKIVHGPLFEWATSGNLGRITHLEVLLNLNQLSPMGSFVIETPWAGFFSAWMTIILEAGFIFAVLLKRKIGFFVLGLLGMHTIIFMTHRILFFDNYLLFLMFVPWDDLYQKAGKLKVLSFLADAIKKPLLHVGGIR